MKGVARSFWVVVAVVATVQVFVGLLAFRSVDNDLTCWVSGLTNRGYTFAACGSSVAIVGQQTWVPAALVLVLFLATLAAGIVTLVSQYVRTRLALWRLGKPLPSPDYLRRIAECLGIEVRLCNDERCFCCCAGLWRPSVVISQGMLELLDDAEVTAVLAHEAAHVHRHDPARALAVRSAANALFYLPVARHLSQRALVASELGADSAAVNVAGRTALVRALIDVLGRARPALGSVTEMASLQSLDSRIEALRTRAVPRPRPRFMILLASVAAIAALGFLGAWLPRPEHNVVFRPAHPVVHVDPSSAKATEPQRPAIRIAPTFK